MRHRIAPSLFSLVTAAALSAVLFAQPPLPGPSASPDTLLVAFRPGAAASEIQTLHNQAGGEVVKTISALALQVVRVPPGRVQHALQVYQANPNTRFAEPNYIRSLFRPAANEGSEPGLGIANNFTEQWGLNNTGQAFGATIDPIFGYLTAPSYRGAADADIDAPEAWALTSGSPSIRIAILDSGISCSHADLDSKCAEQVNFVAEHGSPVDDLLAHGTHVAAIAAAETDNGVGTAGVAPEALVGSLKVCYEDYSLAFLGIVQGLCEDEDIIEGIIHAADNGYHVINMSLAGAELSQALESAVDYAWNSGVVLVAGAGNDYSPDRRYPAAYQNVIAVAATDYFDNLAYFSSFSTDADDWVSVSAPGHVVFAAVPSDQCGLAPDDPEGCYDWKSGTSMATPFVSGIAAMLWSYLPAPSAVQVRAAIEQSADPEGALAQNHLAWTRFGRANLFNALTFDSPDPGGGAGGDTTLPVISNVSSTRLNGPHFQVSWRTDEPADSVLIFVCCGEVRDTSPVTEHSLSLRGQKGVKYEYFVRSTDAAGNQASAGPFYHQN